MESGSHATDIQHVEQHTTHFYTACGAHTDTAVDMQRLLYALDL